MSRTLVKWPSSIRVRLALWHSILLGLPLVLFAVVCYVVFSQALVSSTDRFIDEALSAFTRELGAERRSGLPTEQAMMVTVQEVRFRELHIMILDSTGRAIAKAGPPGELPGDSIELQHTAATLNAIANRLESTDSYITSVPTGAVDSRVRAQALVVDGHRYTLVGRYPLVEAERMLESIRRMFGIAIPLLILAAAFSGYFLALRNLAPVKAITAHAASITGSNLHERVPVSGGDELVRLAKVINDLLDRLEQSFEHQRRFMTDASHELRTPTAIVRTEADVTLSKPHRHEDEYRASVGIMQDASQRLTSIVDDIFMLARADSGHLVVKKTPIYLEEVVDDTTRSAHLLATRKQIDLKLLEMIEAPILGNADLLGRLLLNLLVNAINYSPAQSTVTVAMGARAGMYDVTVINEGPGIPADAHERVFDRFYRVDVARTRQETSHTSGAGLGLAISRRIAEEHGGRLILVESRPGRTVFRFSVPSRSDSDSVVG